ncbi:ribonuclease P protein component [Flammeovirgaceae bacterium SG7u.111]|nr:ribonuclease P protein component [Flammeovirgaceae bacterium SG7u.132]WPO36325.1 ribonuclease P protein component [Flammeovirgaceae bacterium SG7u.111]
MSESSYSPSQNHLFTFPKTERLSSRKEIQKVFTSKKSQFSHPFKVLFVLLSETDEYVAFPQVLISVPKRIFKKAVDRNLIKRRIREAYRLNKNTVWDSEKKNTIKSLAIIYVDKTILPFDKIEKQLIKALEKVALASNPKNQS